MRIEWGTSYPSRYADEPEVWELDQLRAREAEEWWRQAAGRFLVEAGLRVRRTSGVGFLQ